MATSCGTAATFTPPGTLGVPLDLSPDKLGFRRATTSGADIRLSTDTRYQLASEPIDERWIGERPPGHVTAMKRARVR